jgi:hypothetical protein
MDSSSNLSGLSLIISNNSNNDSWCLWTVFTTWDWKFQCPVPTQRNHLWTTRSSRWVLLVELFKNAAYPFNVKKKILHHLICLNICISTTLRRCAEQCTNKARGYFCFTFTCRPLRCPTITAAPTFYHKIFLIHINQQCTCLLSTFTSVIPTKYFNISPFILLASYQQCLRFHQVQYCYICEVPLAQ